jgi:hypothetical protein
MREDIDTEEKYVCADCIGEPFLKREIKKNGEEQICDYCEEKKNCYTLGQVAQRVEAAFEAHYERTSTEPTGYEYAMLADKESDYEWDRSGEKTIYCITEALDSDEEVAEDIMAVLQEKHYDHDDAAMGEESEFDEEAHYEQKYIGDERWQTEWEKFAQTLKTESRYFNQSCINHLEAIFGNLNELRTSEKRPVIAKAGPGTEYAAFYRARVFLADDRLKSAMESPADQFGPPPALMAVAGRMNARGISVFYGANTPLVALAEVRPPVGSKVAIARFEITRELRLLDLSALQNLERSGSIFDKTYAGRLEKATFLENLSNRITIPVMPGSEDFDYLTTQAIADFLASHDKLNLDGILFPSVQARGKSVNVVLFHKASRVKDIGLPKGGKIEADLGSYGEDGWEPLYSITEMIPPVKEKKKVKDDFFPFDDLLDIPIRGGYDPDSRKNTLKIDLETIEIHDVNWVRYKTTVHQVYKSRYENWKGNPFKITDD